MEAIFVLKHSCQIVMGFKRTPNGVFPDIKSDSTDANAASALKNWPNPTLAKCTISMFQVTFVFMVLMDVK